MATSTIRQMQNFILTSLLVNSDNLLGRISKITRVTSVRENQGESGNFEVPSSNQGKSGKIDLFGENQGKIREFHYESGKKIREFR